MSSSVRTPPPTVRRHEAGFRRALNGIKHDRAVFVAGRDIEKAQLVGARGVIGDRAWTGSPRRADRRNARP